eukprot:4019117-Pyramimonas_sp.AAC.1
MSRAALTRCRVSEGYIYVTPAGGAADIGVTFMSQSGPQGPFKKHTADRLQNDFLDQAVDRCDTFVTPSCGQAFEPPPR